MSKVKIIWSREAVKKTKVIYAHILENFNNDRAENFYEELIDFCYHLSKFPKIGKLSQKFGNLREYHFQGNTVYYRVISDSEILIVTLHPRRTVGNLK
jgi:plasmid stabilization system protein ParE